MVLYNGMASTSSWAALYFVALMTFGNYVLFNLLVAILVEGFQAEVRNTEKDGSLGRWLDPLHTVLALVVTAILVQAHMVIPQGLTFTLCFMDAGRCQQIRHR